MGLKTNQGRFRKSSMIPLKIELVNGRIEVKCDEEKLEQKTYQEKTKRMIREL